MLLLSSRVMGAVLALRANCEGDTGTPATSQKLGTERGREIDQGARPSQPQTCWRACIGRCCFSHQRVRWNWTAFFGLQTLDFRGCHRERTQSP